MHHRLLALLVALAGCGCGQSLTGVIDFHVHSDPDSVPRSIDAIDLAKLGQEPRHAGAGAQEPLGIHRFSGLSGAQGGTRH